MTTMRGVCCTTVSTLAALLMAAPVTAAADPPQNPGLPAALTSAIERDLGLSPQEYQRRAELAQRLASFAATRRQLDPGSVRGIRLDGAGRPVVATTDNAVRAAAQHAGFVLTDAAAPGWDAAAAHPGTDRRYPVPELPAAAAPVTPLDTVAGGNRYMSITQPSKHQGAECSWAFNAVDQDGHPAALTAGHCNVAALAEESIGPDQRTYQLLPGDKPGVVTGNFEKSVVDGIRDYSIVRIAEPVRHAFHNNLVRGRVGGPAIGITGVGIPVEGAPVCKSGSTTGFTCGIITAVDQPDPQRPPIRFKHTALTLPGDSGGALVSGSLAMGIVSEGGIYSDPSEFPTDRPGVLPPAQPGLPSLSRILQQIGPGALEQVSPPIDGLLRFVPQVTMIAQSVADVLAENPGVHLRTS
ncbi:S1 family peptidase [Nocardia sp. NEAU-G5]|uniref:S1 family peptidase n=1 Tax=Nocardia albiluteola TaxID=2842303 RepID=A0ABS6B137_9NOCA|nr:S1 family peptidase [Nocardia albiluteola]MBU3062954.1 S1 family peptidase [Nocardia albiluteola]